MPGRMIARRVGRTGRRRLRPRSRPAAAVGADAGVRGRGPDAAGRCCRSCARPRERPRAPEGAKRWLPHTFKGPPRRRAVQNRRHCAISGPGRGVKSMREPPFSAAELRQLGATPCRQRCCRLLFGSVGPECGCVGTCEAPGTGSGGSVSESVAKASRAETGREGKRGISTILLRLPGEIRAFATDSDIAGPNTVGEGRRPCPNAPGQQ